MSEYVLGNNISQTETVQLQQQPRWRPWFQTDFVFLQIDWINSLKNASICFLFQMCDMHVGICDGWSTSLPALYAYLSQRLYWRLADAFLHMSFLYGARWCGSAYNLWNQLTRVAGGTATFCIFFSDSMPAPVHYWTPWQCFPTLLCLWIIKSVYISFSIIKCIVVTKNLANLISQVQ